MVKELKLEIGVRKRVRESRRDKVSHVNILFHETIEGLITTEKIACPYCQQDHFQDRWDVVTGANTRKKMLDCQSRCFVCTKKGHHLEDCKSKRTCFRCKGRHHTSICQRDGYKTQPGSDKADAAGKDDKKKDDISDVTEGRIQSYCQGEVSLANTAVSKKRIAVMQIATVIATNGEDKYN